MLKLQESRICPLEFLIQSASRGTDSAFQSVTFSASTCDWTMGTRADWFCPIVMFCLRSYSKKSPADLPSASEPCFPATPELSAIILLKLRPFKGTFATEDDEIIPPITPVSAR